MLSPPRIYIRIGLHSVRMSIVDCRICYSYRHEPSIGFHIEKFNFIFWISTGVIFPSTVRFIDNLLWSNLVDNNILEHFWSFTAIFRVDLLCLLCCLSNSTISQFSIFKTCRWTEKNHLVHPRKVCHCLSQVHRAKVMAKKKWANRRR